MLAGIVLASALSLHASAARAQSILLPLEGDSEVIPAHEAELRAAIHEELAARGESVVGAEQYLSGEALAGINRCNECIGRLLRERAAERVIIVALWAEEGEPAFVAVTLLDADGEPAEAEASLERRTLREALREALAGALEAWPTRSGVVVRFVGSPRGAAVLVDRYPFGTLPAHGRLSVGPHVVSVVADGEVKARRSIEVPASETPLEFELTRETERAESTERSRRSADGRGFIAGPIVLSIGAGALLVEPARGLVRRGCVETSRGFCAVEERIDRGRFAAYTATSAALAATAVVWGIVGRRKHRERPPRVELGILDATLRF